MSSEDEYESGSGSEEEEEPMLTGEVDEAAAAVLKKVMASRAVDDLESPLIIDGLRHLCGTEPTPIDENALTEASSSAEGRERFLHKGATQTTALLIRELWQLPNEQTSEGPVASLPKATLILPREKPVPEPKPQTRWEKFAEQKGIENKKRGRMVWNDETQQWAPRYGYKRANDDGADWPIMEVKAGDDPNADPWTLRKQEKKARVDKNETNRQRNVQRNGGGDGLKGMFAPAPGIPVDMKKGTKRGKEGVAKALNLTQHSTASMGQFDVKRIGELNKKKPDGARQKKPANDMTKAGIANESTRNSKLMAQVLAQAGRPKLKGDAGEKVVQRQADRDYHPLDDRPYANLGGGDSGDFKKKKGRGGVGKMKKTGTKKGKQGKRG